MTRAGAAIVAEPAVLVGDRAAQVPAVRQLRLTAELEAGGMRMIAELVGVLVLGGRGIERPRPQALAINTLDPVPLAAAVEVADKRPARVDPERAECPQRLTRQRVQAAGIARWVVDAQQRVEAAVEARTAVEQRLQVARRRLPVVAQR